MALKKGIRQRQGAVPVISNVSVTDIGETTVRISWNLSPAGTGRVEYGTTTSYGTLSLLESNHYTYHSQVIGDNETALVAGTLYYYRILSTNQYGTATYATGSFTTASAPSSRANTRTISGIDATGATDVTTALRNWFTTNLVNDCEVIFPTDGHYLVSGNIRFGGFTGITLTGNNCTLELASGSGAGQLQTLLMVGYTGSSFTPCNDVVVKNLNFLAHNHTAGAGLDTAKEQQHAVEIDGGSGFEVSGITSEGCGGDMVKIGDSADDVWIHGCTNVDTGRQGVSVISGGDTVGILIEDNDFGHCGYYVLDVEPNTSGEVAKNVIFRNNTFESWGPETGSGCGFFACLSAILYGADSGYVTVTGNRSYGTGTRSSLRSYVNQNQYRTVPDIVFTNNTAIAADATSGDVLQIESVDGLTVTGNTQPLRSGQALIDAAKLATCSNTVTSPNP